MRFIARDQFGIEVPDVTKALNEHPDMLDNIPAPVNGECRWYALDNPLAGETVETAAEILHIAPRTARDLCARGNLSAFRYPMRWRIPISELEYMAANGVDAE